jgi:hypothetical protein
MPRRPAKVTQADIARAVRAAKEAGANSVTIDSDGIIRIVLSTRSAAGSTAEGEKWAPSDALQRYLKRTESG